MLKKSIAVLCALSLAFSQCIIIGVSAKPDTTAPVIKSATPRNNQTGIATNVNINLAFSENIYKSIYFSKIKLTKSNKATEIKVSISKNYLKISQTNSLVYSTTYVLSIPAKAVKDKAGNMLKNNITIKFKTKAKTTSTPNPNGVKQLNNTLHDIAITAKIKKDYDKNMKPTSITRKDGINLAIIRYYPNGSLDYIKTDANTIIAHQFSKARIMCDYTACSNSEFAHAASSAIANGTYDFTKNAAAVKVCMNALSKDITLEKFCSITNNNSVTEKILQNMKNLLCSGQVGAVIYGKSSNGILVGKYVFVNPSWFNETSPKGTYFCIDSENQKNFGKAYTADYTVSYNLIP